MPFSFFSFLSNDTEIVPVPAWAKKIGRTFTNLFDPDAGSQPVASNRSKDTSFDMLNAGETSSTSPFHSQWRVYNDRKNVYHDIERMDHEDPIVATALDITADNATDFLEDINERVQYRSTNPKVQKILTDLSYRLDLNDAVKQIARECAAHGSIFREVVIDKNLMKITNFKQTVAYQIYPKTNDRGDKIPGWELKIDRNLYDGTVIDIAEWQIIPFIFGAKKGFLSVPPLAAARRGWKRLTQMEDGMATARIVRAYDKLVHKVPVRENWTSDDILKTMKRYKDGITKRKMETGDGNPGQTDQDFAVGTDIYMPDDGTGRGGVTVLQSNNVQLGNLNDVYYNREQLTTRLRVPIAALQLVSGQKTHMKGGGSMGSADVEFARYVRGIQAVIRRGFERLGDMELMLNGVPATRGLYEVSLCTIDTADPSLDAEILLTNAQAAVYFVEAFGALPTDLLAAKFLTLTPDQQKLMNTFLSAHGDAITALRIKALEMETVPGARPMSAPSAATGTPKASSSSGSGNNNKSLASRSAEQVGGKKSQGIDVDSLVDLFAQLHQSINQEIDGVVIPTPIIDDNYRRVIKQNLLDIAYCGDEKIVN